VPVANPLAFQQGTRGGERNLNRHFVPRADPRDYEDRVTRQLAVLLAAHDALLDLHSFHTAGAPLPWWGRWTTPARASPSPAPPKSWRARAGRAAGGAGLAGGVRPRGPCARPAAGRRRHRHQRIHAQPGRLRRHPGVRLSRRPAGDRGGRAGHPRRAGAPGPGCRAAPAPHGGRVARLREVVLREAPGDTLARDWRSFDPVAAGELLGTRADGRAVRAQRAGCVLFPFPESQVDQEWFYLAELDAAGQP
jgi:hypothetical protein